jgi:hypothetical protein
MKINELLNEAAGKSVEVNSAKTAEKIGSFSGPITLKGYYSDYPSVDSREERQFNRVVRNSAKTAGGKYKRNDFLDWTITLDSENLKKFFDTIENEFYLADVETEYGWGITFEIKEGMS